eukprot:4693419-Pleurochrysis_carterae.AAC.1
MFDSLLARRVPFPRPSLTSTPRIKRRACSKKAWRMKKSASAHLRGSTLGVRRVQNSKREAVREVFLGVHADAWMCEYVHSMGTRFDEHGTSLHS